MPQGVTSNATKIYIKNIDNPFIDSQKRASKIYQFGPMGTSSSTPAPGPTANPTTSTVAKCGNGVKDGDEQCDDGQDTGTCPKICSASCTSNNCWSGVATAPNNPNDGSLDVLSYIIGNPSNWPRTGTHEMNQVVGKNNVVWHLKFGDPTKYEIWRWDDRYIYHHEDRTAEGGISWHYQSNNIWAKRWMKDGEKVPNQGGDIIDLYSNNGCQYAKTRNTYYTQTLFHYPNYNAGGEIGIADVIVFKNDIGSADLTYELFYFAIGWGWFKFEGWDHRAGRQTQPGYTAVFNRKGGSKIFPSQSACIPLPDGSRLPT